MLGYAMLFYAFQCFAVPCNAMIDLLCFAVLGYAWLCLAVLSFALLWFWGWPVSLSRTGRKMREIQTIYAAIRPQSQIPRKNALFDPLCGGDHGRAQKVKIYNKNITENHSEKSRDDFWRNFEENLAFLLIFRQNRRKNTTKIVVRTNWALPNSTKIMVRTILVLFLSSRNAAYSSLLEKKPYSEPNR